MWKQGRECIWRWSCQTGRSRPCGCCSVLWRTRKGHFWNTAVKLQSSTSKCGTSGECRRAWMEFVEHYWHVHDLTFFKTLRPSRRVGCSSSTEWQRGQKPSHFLASESSYFNLHYCLVHILSLFLICKLDILLV